MKKPRILTKCVANTYAAADERIIEISNGGQGGTLKGCLLSVRVLSGGDLELAVYRRDRGVRVLIGEVQK